MLKLRTLFYLLNIVTLLASCSKRIIHTNNYNSFSRIEVVGGPEDFHPDTIVGQRILFSCDDRRAKVDQGSIWAYDLKKEIAEVLPFEPALDFDFHPHGIHLINIDEKTYLFVINHISKNISEIDRFVIHSESTVYEHCRKS
jgi:hypothetical protein